MTKRHFDYYNRKNPEKGYLNYDEFMRFSREREPFLKLTDKDFEGPPPEGHMKPLGFHNRKEMKMEIDVIDHTMHPRDFWSKYVSKHKPVLLRGIDQGKGWEKWDEDYIKKHFGWVDLKIEPKIENRGNSPILNNMPKRLNISTYFETMRESTLYAVSILPQEMAWDVNFPAPMLCGGRNKKPSLDSRNPVDVKHPFPHDKGRQWMTHLYEANLWLGYGRTRSQLHYDKEQNVNCLYRGEKKWILIDTRTFYNDVTWVRGGRFQGEDDLKNTGTDWVAIDPDAVDLIVHKSFRNVKYYEFTQKAGDCVFLPYAMLHWVNKTNPGFQAAVSYMWLPEESYDEEVCKKAPLVNIPMGAMDILWYYNGTGVIPQGYPDPVNVVRSLIGIMQQMRTQYLTKNVIYNFCQQGDNHCKHDKREIDYTWQQMVDAGGPKTDPDQGIHISEMWWPKLPLGNWLKLAAETDSEGMLPCDEGQRYVYPPEEELAKQDTILTEIEEKWNARNVKAEN